MGRKCDNIGNVQGFGLVEGCSLIIIWLQSWHVLTTGVSQHESCALLDIRWSEFCL